MQKAVPSIVNLKIVQSQCVINFFGESDQQKGNCVSI